MAKELMVLVHENPEVVIVGFKDPSYELPEALERLFTIKSSLRGISRDVLPKLITRNEARRLGVDTFDPYHLYKYVSGLNPVRFREIMDLVMRNKMDFDPRSPDGPAGIYKEIREITCESMEISTVKWDDIGGYEDVKQIIKTRILDKIGYIDRLDSVDKIRRIEKTIPRGIILEGPPGTGKTYFAKAIAASLNATVTIVSGPEIVDKYVGESEKNIRDIFEQARKSAPSVIVFDEMDSIAGARDASRNDSGVRNSIVNQLLTELDGFRSEEMVFVVGTTNFAESLDPALLRPGRFGLVIEVPYPGPRDRFDILSIYNDSLGLGLSEEQLGYLVNQTDDYYDLANNARYAGDHLSKICLELDSILIDQEMAGEEPTISKHDIDNLGTLRGGPGQSYAVEEISWADIGGYEKVKKDLKRDIVDEINELRALHRDPDADPREIALVAAAIPKGILLEGPPGTGKTQFAKAIATAIGARTTVIKGPEILSMWVGKSEANLRDIFKTARRDADGADAPALIIFDEIDTIASRRTGGPSSQSHDKLVGQLLTEMDGFSANDMVFVVATTNFAQSLDPALLRPSRFGKTYHIDYPRAAGRKAIFNVYNEKQGLDLNEKLINILVARTGGQTKEGTRFSGDHIKNICEDLYRTRKRRSRLGEDPTLTEKDIDDVDLLGSYVEPRTISAADYEHAAVHEAGHTLVAALLPGVASPHEVTIEGDEDMMSPFYTQLFEDDSFAHSRNDLIDTIATMLAGKMTEEFVRGHITTGIWDDLMKASDVAREMVERFGMGSFKQSLYVYDREDPRGKRRQLSAKKEAEIDREVELILSEAQDIVRNILHTHKKQLDDLIEALLVRRKLLWADIKEIIGIVEKDPETKKDLWDWDNLDLADLRRRKRKRFRLRRYRR
jgi:SpoVK/Ycf46/Vps4 family AAA+-type ATPase